MSAMGIYRQLRELPPVNVADNFLFADDTSGSSLGDSHKAV